MDVDGRYDPPPAPDLPDAAIASEGACDRCGTTPGRVNQYMWVMSFLLFTRHATYETCLCRRCATRVGLEELGKSALLGWWGIPWGLLTFRALWLDLRSLFRWSTVPRAALVAVVLAGLALPIAGVATLLRVERDTSRAKATGDWASEHVVALVDQGHAKRQQGEVRAALGFYQKAYASAPESSVVNFSLAQCHAALGEYQAALPFARVAEERNPEHPGYAAFHGWLLARTGDLEGARQRARQAVSMRLDDASDVDLVAELLWELEEWDPLDRVAASASENYPDTPELSIWRLFALLGKDDLEGFEAVWAKMPEAHRQSPRAVFARDLFLFRSDPAGELPRRLDSWLDNPLDSPTARLFTRAAVRAGFLEEARRRVLAWLADPATPGRAWYAAVPWIPPERLTEELDAYLDRRTEAEPLYLRLSSLDPVEDRARVLELARRGREFPTREGGILDAAYVHLSLLVKPSAAWRQEMEAHVRAHPEHDYCRVMLGSALLEVEPGTARRLLEAPVGGDDPGLNAFYRYTLAELSLVEGRFAEVGPALVDLEQIDEEYADRARLLRLELALYLHDDDAFERTSAALAASVRDEVRAAGMVLAWVRQAAEGKPPTYREDVDSWLARADVAAAKRSTSASTQAILLLEERTDRETAARALGQLHPATFQLVRLLRDSAISGKIDRAACGRLTKDPAHPHDWATRLSRFIHEKLGFEVARTTEGMSLQASTIPPR